MAKDIFQFQITDITGHYLYVNAGVVTTSVTPVTLLSSVVDWNKLQLRWIRHKTYFGVFRKQMPDSMRFANDGARIIRWLYNTQGGTEARGSFIINKLNTSDQTYYQLGVFDLDFSGDKYKSSYWYVDVGLMQGGITALLQAYDSTNYSIMIGEPMGTPNPAPPLNPTNIYMQGMPFIETYNYQLWANSDGSVSVISGLSVTPAKTIGMVYVNRDDAFFNGQDTYSGGSAASSEPNLTTAPPSPSFIFNFTFATQVANLKGFFNIDTITTNPGSGTSTVSIAAQRWGMVSGSLAIISTTTLWTSPAIPAGSSLPGIGIVDIDTSTISGWPGIFNAGDYLVLEVVGTNAMESISFITSLFAYTDGAYYLKGQYASGLSLSVNVWPTPEVVASYSQWQVFQMLLQNLMCTNPIPYGTVFPLSWSAVPGPPTNPAGYDNLPLFGKSDLLSVPRSPTGPGNYDVDPTETYFTSGNALRGVQYNGSGSAAYLNMNISDFVKDAFVRLCAGLGVENIGGTDTVVLEHLSHFFQADVLIADLGLIPMQTFTITPYVDGKANNLKVGYNNNTYSDANGYFEYNHELEFITQVRTINEVSDLDLKSPYRADPYGIETERLQNSQPNSNYATDDNEVFILQSNGYDAGLTSGEIAPYGDGTPLFSGPFFPPSQPVPSKELLKPTNVSGLPQWGYSAAHSIPSLVGVAELAYNIPLSPKRNLLRLLPWIKSVYYDVPDQTLSFMTSPRPGSSETSSWGDLSADCGSGSIDEQENILPTDPAYTSAQILFKPHIFEFTMQVPLDLADLMATKPYGVFGGTVTDIDGLESYIEGFVLEVGITPGTNDTFDFKLLCSPNTTIPANL